MMLLNAPVSYLQIAQLAITTKRVMGGWNVLRCKHLHQLTIGLVSKSKHCFHLLNKEIIFGLGSAAIQEYQVTSIFLVISNVYTHKQKNQKPIHILKDQLESMCHLSKPLFHRR